MKKYAGLILVMTVVAAITTGCQKSELVSSFTGRETTYALQQGSSYPVSGTVTFRERKDGRISALIQLTGVDGASFHPVHLHLGGIGAPGADIALLMTPVYGKTGISETTFDKLSDESSIDYQRLTTLNACVKIHLDNGANRNVVLAAGNIGSALTEATPGGRLGVAVCKSE